VDHSGVGVPLTQRRIMGTITQTAMPKQAHLYFTTHYMADLYIFKALFLMFRIITNHMGWILPSSQHRLHLV